MSAIYAHAMQGRTPLAKLHPASAMVWTGALIVAIFATVDLKLGLLIMAIQVLLILLGRLPLLQIAKVMLLVVPLCFFITVIQGLTVSGPALVTIGSLAFSTEGVILGLSITIRVANLAVAMTNFFAAVHPVRLAVSLNKMGMPFKYAYTTVLALRFLPLVLAELETIRNAQKARGYDIDRKNFVVRAVMIMPLMVPLLVIVLRRAGTIALAMDLRAFAAFPDRTHRIDVAPPAAADHMVWGLSVITMAAILTLELL